MDNLITLFLMFLKIGFTSFGGGYGMMSTIMDEGARLVGLTKGEFADMTALDLVCSGPVAINAATYVGYIKGGIWGSIFSTVGAFLPSLILTSIVLVFLEKFYNSFFIRGLFKGITPATGGLMIFTSLTLTKSIFFNVDHYSEIPGTPITPTIVGMFIILILSIIGDLKFKINPIYLTLAGALLGAIFLRG